MQKLIRTGIAVVLISVFGAALANPGYKPIDPPHASEGSDKIEVVEIFWYGCPHCHDFEPYLDAWLETKPDDVEFIRMPGIFRQDWLAHARAFYAAEQLGVLEAAHGRLFNEIHNRGKRLNSESQLKQFFMQMGIDGDAFTRAYNSAETENRIKEALAKARRYQVTGVPAVVVNGKYLTSGPLAGSFERMIEVIDELIDQERAALDAAGASDDSADTTQTAATH